MLDIKFLRENPDIVKQNIKNKFQDQKLGLVDEVIELDAEKRKTQQEAEEMMEMLCRQMAEREHVTEELKEADPIKWTALMNSIRASAEEIVKKELIQI